MLADAEQQPPGELGHVGGRHAQPPPDVRRLRPPEQVGDGPHVLEHRPDETPRGHALGQPRIAGGDRLQVVHRLDVGRGRPVDRHRQPLPWLGAEQPERRRDEGGTRGARHAAKERTPSHFAVLRLQTVGPVLVEEQLLVNTSRGGGRSLCRAERVRWGCDAWRSPQQRHRIRLRARLDQAEVFRVLAVQHAQLLPVERAGLLVPPLPGTHHVGCDPNSTTIAFAEAADLVRDPLQ
jgi:hypothetical protein